MLGGGLRKAIKAILPSRFFKFSENKALQFGDAYSLVPVRSFQLWLGHQLRKIAVFFFSAVFFRKLSKPMTGQGHCACTAPQESSTYLIILKIIKKCNIITTVSSVHSCSFLLQTPVLFSTEVWADPCLRQGYLYGFSNVEAQDGTWGVRALLLATLGWTWVLPSPVYSPSSRNTIFRHRFRGKKLEMGWHVLEHFALTFRRESGTGLNARVV